MKRKHRYVHSVPDWAVYYLTSSSLNTDVPILRAIDQGISTDKLSALKSYITSLRLEHGFTGQCFEDRLYLLDRKFVSDYNDMGWLDLNGRSICRHIWVEFEE
jgi:hypothetical protein